MDANMNMNTAPITEEELAWMRTRVEDRTAVGKEEKLLATIAARDAAHESVQKLAKCAGLDGKEPIAELSQYIQQLQHDLRSTHQGLCKALGVNDGLLEDLIGAVVYLKQTRDAAMANEVEQVRVAARWKDRAERIDALVAQWGTAHEAVATGIRDVIAEAFPKPEACVACATIIDGASVCSRHAPVKRT